MANPLSEVGRALLNGAGWKSQVEIGLPSCHRISSVRTRISQRTESLGRWRWTGRKEGTMENPSLFPWDYRVTLSNYQAGDRRLLSKRFRIHIVSTSHSITNAIYMHDTRSRTRESCNQLISVSTGPAVPLITAKSLRSF